MLNVLSHDFLNFRGTYRRGNAGLNLWNQLGLKVLHLRTGKSY